MTLFHENFESFPLAYIAPEIPALSATFVYEELLALERRGYPVLPISVHRPAVTATGQAELATRCLTVYDAPKWRVAWVGLSSMFALPGFRKAAGWLLADLRELGASGAALKLAFQFLAGATIARFMCRAGVRHLHIHFAHVPTQIGMYAAAMAGIPFTVMAHANDIFERGLLLSRKAERARKFMTISAYNLAYLERKGVNPEHLAVVRCGVSFPVRNALPSRESRLSWRIGTLGRLVEKKGVDVLIRAIQLLRLKGHDIELTVAGDGPLREELETLTLSLGLVDSVRFAGNLPHSEVRGWMHGLDLFVLACKEDANGDMDGIPVVLMEAMSQQVPVISTRLSGIPELVIDYKTGLLALPGDEIDLASQIAHLIETPGLAQSLALAGIAHIRSEFGQDVNLDRLLGHMGLAS